jgi:hypothetical protein
MALRRTFRVTPVFLVLVSTAACVSQPGPSTRAGTSAPKTLSDGSPAISVRQESVRQPRIATYTCVGGEAMTIENRGSSVRVTSPDGAIDEELPASPINQRSRFGVEHDAVVIDGSDALIMRSGHTPMTCKR